MGNFAENIAEEVKRQLKDPRFQSLQANRVGVSGRIFYVLKASATNYAQFAEDHPDYRSGDGVVTSATVYNTIDAAVGACTAGQGDIIYVMPGHTENISSATSLALDVAGVTIIGLGVGTNRPTLNFSATAGKINVTAANVLMKNILFTGGIDAVVNAINVAAAHFEMHDCEYRDVTGQITKFIITTAAADYMKIKNLVFRGDTANAGTTSAFEITGGNGIEIISPDIVGDFGTSIIEIATTATTQLRIYGTPDKPAYFRTYNSVDLVLKDTVTGSTGFVGPFIYAMLKDNAANITEAFTAATMVYFQDIMIANLAGEVGMQTNITASTDA
jgi:hypothetical protein